MYVLISGESPFPDDELTDAVMEGRLDLETEVWRLVTDEALDVLRQMTAVNAAERITSADLLKHKWFQKCFPNRDKPRQSRNLDAPGWALEDSDPFEETIGFAGF
jgi:serine/threonine protein kinase